MKSVPFRCRLVSRFSCLLVPLMVGFCTPACPGQDTGPVAVDFIRDIRPLLADYCFACHGPDAATREGGFRFDVRDSALGEADSGEHPVVPGDLTASEMIRRITATDDSERMPPAEFKKQLSSGQIELLQRWIREGAAWEEHWAYLPPQRPEVPAVPSGSRAGNPVDNFVLFRLEIQGLSQSPAAAPETLVRRLYLDLTGLPPTPGQVDDFLKNDSPLAYEELVDQLLDSPHYGEHMATFWLDAARFADTNGYQNDFRRSMWLWRDWVIDAFNNNMPFDQFAIEQIAGDMLPDATLDQKIATGFNRNHRMNTEGGSINEEWLVENVVDRVETTTTVFLGLTMGCARCHDHKFDPVTQQEFYEFFAYFNNIDEKGVYEETRGNVAPLVEVETREFLDRRKLARDELDVARRVVEKLDLELADRQSGWEARIAESDLAAGPAPQLTLLGPEIDARPASLTDVIAKARSAGAVTDESTGPVVQFSKQDHQPLDLGDAWRFDASRPCSIGVWVRPSEYGAIISRMDEPAAYRGFDMLIMPDGRMNVHLIHEWPGNATKITTVPVIPRDQWTHVGLTWSAPGKAANLCVYFNGRPVEHTVDSDTLEGTTLTEHPVWLGLRARTPAYVGKISGLQIRDWQLGDAQIESLYNVAVARWIAIPADQRTDETQADLQHHFRASQPACQDALDQLRTAELKLAEIQKQIPTTMVMAEREEPRPTWVLQRGQYDRPDKTRPVSAGVPALFRSARPPANRLELARWLVDGNNPLTARVAVNHFWARYFGIGLLETAENFGVQSPPPSHPQLLDWLATEFVRSGWDIKHLQRLIVNSATYRQASSATAARFQADPDNRWLARGPRFRLPAETIRDNALTISGLLTPRIGGPSIKPYQPAGLWEELAGGAKEPPYEVAEDDNLYRRSLYIYRKRTVPHPTMTTFDGTSREVCVVARSRTNTPLQALALLNDLTYVEAARHLASRALEAESDPDERLRFAFRSAVARWPDDRELAILQQARDRYGQQFATAPEQAAALIQNGKHPLDAGHDPLELATLMSVCSVILNLDEVITKE